MEHAREFYIDGKWVAPLSGETLAVINPATEAVIESIAMGGPDDVDVAVAAARAAFETYSQTTRDERLALLDRIIEVYKRRMGELGEVISQEMGAPLWMAQRAQAGAGLGHFLTARRVLADFEFEEEMGTTLVVREPIGVCGLITPWNWPLNQIACKVAPALAAGCTMVLKPSEVAPLERRSSSPRSSTRPVCPPACSTWSTATASTSARRCRPTRTSTWCRSPARPVPASRWPSGRGADGQARGPGARRQVGQHHPRRRRPRGRHPRPDVDVQQLRPVVQRADPHAGAGGPHGRGRGHRRRGRRRLVVGDPADEASSNIGPVVSGVQYDRIQQLIEKGIGEGAKLEIGGPGKPEGLETGLLRASRPCSPT